ncbi:MAG: hypothetical protein ACTSQG_05805 [Promethearchaeota archaeon]
MTMLQQYFKKNYDAYLRLKNQFELQDIENELEIEIEADEQESIYSKDFFDFVDEMSGY